MRSVGNRHFCGALFLAAFSLVVAGCGTKGVYKKGVKGADLIPLSYPHSGLRAGAVGTGTPGSTPDQYRPSDQNFSAEFLDNIAESDAAWFGRDNNWKRQLKTMVEPGASGEVLRKLRIAGGDAKVQLTNEGVKFVDWGELTEDNIDLQRLSEAIVRGWYNLSGPQMSVDCLAMMRPDDHDLSRQWWIVSRSVSSNGLQYEVTRKMGEELAAEAAQQVYLSGELTLKNFTSTSTTLQINKPMVLGYDVVTLRDVQPPLPMLKDAVRLDAKDHVFVWKDRDSGKTWKIKVDQDFMKEAQRRASVDNSLAAPVVSNLYDSLKQSRPIPVSVLYEAKDASSDAPWRILADGSGFSGREMVRLTFTLSEPGYAYIVSRDSEGKAAVLYPRVPGEELSIGEPVRLSAGSYRFPKDFDLNQAEGMGFDPNSRGTESFVVIATREPSPNLVASLGRYAQEARRTAGQTEGQTFNMPGLTRTVSHYVESNTSNARPVQLPAFSGVDGATVVSVNLNIHP